MKTKWQRVNRGRQCPICGRPDWCLIASDESAAICARVESDRPAGKRGAGWLHRLRDDDWQRPKWRTPKRVEPERPTKNMRDIAVANCKAIREQSRVWLANELCLSVDSLMRLRVGWSDGWKAFSFPMRYPNGNVSGIRYRRYDGGKFAEPGSKDGLFFRPDDLRPNYIVVVEGASDAAAVMDSGFYSVVGRAACRSNAEQIVTLLRRRRPKRLVIVPDNDQPGITGAHALRVNIELAGGRVEILTLPDGIKDCRQCIQETKNAEWLAGELGKLCGTEPQQRKDADEHRDIYIPTE
ncbi:MAG: toprim domain-containing protein [bacterium]|nr:toprim domain-containing protein [bacterium]